MLMSCFLANFDRYLNLGSNNLTTIQPDAFNCLDSLARLILSENPLAPEEHPLAGLALRKLHFLDLSFTGLASVPRPATPMVRDLRLGHNALESVKVEDFENFPHLTLLVLDDNKISEVRLILIWYFFFIAI
jgi:Leucine-rich repeat (LRR) protein